MDHPVSPTGLFHSHFRGDYITREETGVGGVGCDSQVTPPFTRGLLTDGESASPPATVGCGGNFLLFYLGEGLLELAIGNSGKHLHSCLHKSLLFKKKSLLFKD